MDNHAFIKTEFSFEEEKSIDDLDKFILLVRARPELYDSSLKDHHNQELVRRVWQDIASELGVAVSACKIKWHCLRTSYNRYLRQIKKLTKNSKVKKRKWYLADKMSFIEPFICPYKKVTSRPTQIVPETVSEDQDYLNACTDSDDNASARTFDDSECSDLRKRKSATEMMASCFKPLDVKRTSLDDDPMVCFLKGLLPDINRLSDRRRRNFRSDILQTLNFYLDEQEEESKSPSMFCADYLPVVQTVIHGQHYNDQQEERIITD